MPTPTSLAELLTEAVSAVPGGTTRPGQQQMVEAVGTAIETGEHLLVQAGTGTGKSLGYLVPALHSKKRVVVATATLALQAQLVESDLPRLTETLASTLGKKPSFALLKGRHHYACLAKLEGAAEDSLVSDSQQWLGELSQLEKQIGEIRKWSRETSTGDRSDLETTVNDATWRRVSMPANECVGAQRCPFGEECFAEAARAQARQADVVVTNHTLLAIDLLNGRTVLPSHEVLVVDEAHELPGHVTSAARAELRPETLRRIARRVATLVGNSTAEKFELAEEALESALTAVPQGRIEQLPAGLTESLTLTSSAVTDAVTTLSGIASANDDDDDAVAAHQHTQLLRDLAEVVNRLAKNSPDDVTWKEADDRGRQALVIAPLSVTGQLGRELFSERTVIATSATLTVGGDFDDMARGFGLESAESPTWRALDVGSPFDYPKQGILYVASRLPRLTASGLPEVAQTELVELVKAAGGRTLGLFSSRKAATQAYEVVSAQTDFPVMLQGEDSLSHLVRRFKEEDRSCLFGVMSLWQGVDVPGSACQLVVIDRLPFPRPDDPLPAARAAAADQAGQSGFRSVFVPHAAIRLAQGAGRLIRTGADKGVVAILDSRLHSAGYGRYIRRSLPPLWYTTDAEVVRNALRRLDAATG